MKELVITIVDGAKKFNEAIEITSTRADILRGRMIFTVQPGSELHDLFAIDNDMPILCTWGVGVSRPWYEIQSNPDNTYYVSFGRG